MPDLPPEPADGTALYWPETRAMYGRLAIRDDAAAGDEAAGDDTAAHWWAPNSQDEPVTWSELVKLLDANGTTPLADAVHLRRRAQGGIVDPGRPYLVGESGCTLTIPNTPAQHAQDGPADPGTGERTAEPAAAVSGPRAARVIPPEVEARHPVRGQEAGMSECAGAGCTHHEHQDGDPIVKYDGAGQPVRASQLADHGLNRAERRAEARAARRRGRR